MSAYIVRLSPGERRAAVTGMRRVLGDKYGWSNADMGLIHSVEFAAVPGYSTAMNAERADLVSDALQRAELPALADRFKTGRVVAQRVNGRWRAPRRSWATARRRRVTAPRVSAPRPQPASSALQPNERGSKQ